MQSTVDQDGGRDGAEAQAQVENISPKDAYDEIRAGIAIALDVREPVEWEHHIEGSVQVPRGLLEFAADPSSPTPQTGAGSGKPCDRHTAGLAGARAALAAQTLKTLGFENVVNLEGGFGAWIEADLPTDEHHSDL